MKKSSVAKCSECKKRRVITAWVSFNQFCHDCWRTVLTDPKVMHKYQMASNQIRAHVVTLPGSTTKKELRMVHPSASAIFTHARSKPASATVLSQFNLAATRPLIQFSSGVHPTSHSVHCSAP
jgi:hypothetical protein